jgi:predicted house-cleaning noncanonical NTP pyrophosphatase (MazG superfamily)
MSKNLDKTIHKMRKLYEFSYNYDDIIMEDENNEEQTPQDDNMQQPQPGDDMMGGDMQQQPQGDDMMGGDMQQQPQGDDMMGGGMQQPQQGDDMMGGEINGANLAPNAGLDDDMSMGDGMNGEMDPMDPMTNNDDMVGPDDEVVDITELTDAQEEIQQNQEEVSDNLSDVDEKLATLMKVVNKFEKALENNDKKILDLKNDLVKRCPTEEETMNVRLNAGGNPFAQKPEEFWDKFKDINNHYNITKNNDAPQYQIKKSDIDNYNDKILDDSFDDIPKSLHDYFVN